MTAARSSTAQGQPAYSSRLRSKPASARPNYVDDDSDLDRALAEHDPSPRSTTTDHSRSRAPVSASSSGSVPRSNRAGSTNALPSQLRQSGPGSTSSSVVSDLDSDLDSDTIQDIGQPVIIQTVTKTGTTVVTTNSKTSSTAVKRSSVPSTMDAAPKKRKQNAAAAAASAAASATTTASSSSASSATPAAAPAAPTSAPQILIPALSGPKAGSKRSSNRPPTPVEAPLRPRTIHCFEKHDAKLNSDEALVSDDGTCFVRNDFVYMICEPPGEPYYIGRIMEFRHQVPNSSLTTSTSAESINWPVQSVRVNWVYRPRDVQRATQDTRLVYATMHSDICPLSSLRGRCQVVHRADIDDIDQFRKLKDAFWFNQAFDRFIHRWYEVVPASQVINVPENVKKALDAHWKYIIVEAAKVKELTSEVKTCKRCVKYCATNDSVDCAVCHTAYHMNCVRPPLLKKPSRGFAWACAPCNRAQERRMERAASGRVENDDEEEVIEEEEDPLGGLAKTPDDSPTESTADSRHTSLGDDDDSMTGILPVTEAEVAQAEMWQMRYLGLHCRIEDVLQYDDRAIYPRASSRLGPKHQANVVEWFGRPVQLVKVHEVKRKGGKNNAHRKESKLNTVEEASRPGWIQNEPLGYVARGEDIPDGDSACTAKLQFKLPTFGEHSERGLDQDEPAPAKPTSRRSNGKLATKPISPMDEDGVEAYMKRAREMAKSIGVPEHSVDYLDWALQLLHKNKFDAELSLRQLRRIDKLKHLSDPNEILTEEQKKKFEEGVSLYGSELRLVRRHAGIESHAAVVRYYYLWKKTPRGREIWGGYAGRKNTRKKTESADPATRLADELADEGDDSAFDSEKAAKRRKRFQCKFCGVKRSRLWRRAPVGPTGSETGRTVGGRGNGTTVSALCQRCGNLWRRYAVQWEDGEEVGKRLAQGGGRAWRRRVDEELLSEWRRAQEGGAQEEEYDPSADPPRKKSRKEIKADPRPEPETRPEVKQEARVQSTVEKEAPVVESRRRSAPRQVSPVRPPTPPEPPRFKVLPCAVCKQSDKAANLFVCTICRIHVHRQCYGVEQSTSSSSWMCDMCTNDRIGKEATSYSYECVLCSITETEQELVEPASRKQADKEMATKFAEDYRLQQRQYGRPVMPREPLKRTSGNNWVHVKCAVWTPEVRFSNASMLEKAEGIPLIPAARFSVACSVCNQRHRGACVECEICNANMHVGCAAKAGHRLVFYVQPVKTARKEVISLGSDGSKNVETGSVAAIVICKSHDIEQTKYRVVHQLHESVPRSGSTASSSDPADMINALQLFVQTYKQADLALTGTTRKANMLDEARRINGPAAVPAPVVADSPEPKALEDEPSQRCFFCKSDVSIIWFPVPDESKESEDEPDAVMCVPCSRRRKKDGESISPLRERNAEKPSSPSRSLIAALTAAAEAGRAANRLGSHVRSRAISPGPSAAPPIPPVAASPPGLPSSSQPSGAVPPAPAVAVPHAPPAGRLPPSFPPWSHRVAQQSSAPVYIPPPPNTTRDWTSRGPNGIVQMPPMGPAPGSSVPQVSDAHRDRRVGSMTEGMYGGVQHHQMPVRHQPPPPPPQQLQGPSHPMQGQPMGPSNGHARPNGHTMPMTHHLPPLSRSPPRGYVPLSVSGLTRPLPPHSISPPQPGAPLPITSPPRPIMPIVHQARPVQIAPPPHSIGIHPGFVSTLPPLNSGRRNSPEPVQGLHHAPVQSQSHSSVPVHQLLRDDVPPPQSRLGMVAPPVPGGQGGQAGQLGPLGPSGNGSSGPARPEGQGASTNASLRNLLS